MTLPVETRLESIVLRGALDGVEMLAPAGEDELHLSPGPLVGDKTLVFVRTGETEDGRSVFTLTSSGPAGGGSSSS